MNEVKKACIEIGLFFLLIAVMLPRTYMIFDFDYWTNWAIYIHQNGLTNIYNNPTVDYHPLYFYFLWFYDKIQGNEYYITENINYIKLLPLVFDILPLLLLRGFRQGIIKAPIPHMYLLLNVAYLFNTCVWGQIDSIFTCLCLFAILQGFRRPILSAVLFALAIALKPHPIIFIPLLLLTWAYGIKNIKTAIYVLVSMLATWLIIALPFIIKGQFSSMWHVITSAVGRYPKVSIGAFNIWYLIIPSNPYFTTDTDKFFILSYKQIGLILFIISSGILLLTVLFRLGKSKFEKIELSQDTIKMLMLTSGLIALYFFYFNTQMHERYAHPAILFIFFYAVLEKDYKLYILVSIPYFLSLDKLLPDFLPVQHYKIIWASKVIALWYTGAIIYGSYEFYRQFKLKEEYKAFRRAIRP